MARPVSLSDPMVPSDRLEEMVSLLRSIAENIQVLRQVLAGPHVYLTFTPAGVGISVPATIQPGETLQVVPAHPGPGSLFFASVVTTSPNVILRFAADGQAVEVPTWKVEVGEFSPFAPPAFVTQADRANSLYTTVIWPGDSFGYPFYRSGALSVQNMDTSAVQLLDFFVRIKEFRPLEEFRAVFFGRR